MATLSHELPLGAHAERRFEYRVIDTGKHLEEELNTLGARLEGGRRHDKEAAVHRSAAGDHPDARARRSRLRAKQRSSARRTGPADWGMPGRRIRELADGASRESRDGPGGGSPMSSGARPASHRVHRPHRRVVWSLVGLVAAAASASSSASTERSFRARRSTRGRRSRAWCRESTPAAAPSSSRRTARSRTGARSGSAWSSCLRSRSRRERTRSPISPAGRETPPQRRRSTRAGSRAG